MVIVLVDNHGYASIGALSRSVGSRGFGTHYRGAHNGALPLDTSDGQALDHPAASDALPLDLAGNAESLGAKVIRAVTIDDLRAALNTAREPDGPVVIYIESDRYAGVPGYESWWDVPVAEVSSEADVRAARETYEQARRSQRTYMATTDE
jgi:3D-(3,5/4)-trihydroxycyclohexane-1,2-dione acylhydrolase (decyclizing)